ncbi:MULTISPECIES: DUF7683 domain-containing protein [Streptomyces]|uniref:DUF7683 domain-containing protein n=1 Tax=Streptomyces TaxID=1883 RepID=UPI001E2F460B|nr:MULTISPECIES: hypothetical protein [Streptomyces]UFQ14041.1 hypothetical protein J2N69_02855 [Streptomyces huasconensis]WCL90114.1 hypothetical protein PPN52_02850 [Streptomyces sp. JCM 35825]
MKILITVYRKDSDFPERELVVSGIGLEAAADVVGIPADRLVDVYPLEENQAAALGRLADVRLDLDSYEYFLEAAEG